MSRRGGETLDTGPLPVLTTDTPIFGLSSSPVSGVRNGEDPSRLVTATGLEIKGRHFTPSTKSETGAVIRGGPPTFLKSLYFVTHFPCPAGPFQGTVLTPLRVGNEWGWCRTGSR